MLIDTPVFEAIRRKLDVMVQGEPHVVNLVEELNHLVATSNIQGEYIQTDVFRKDEFFSGKFSYEDEGSDGWWSDDEFFFFLGNGLVP